MHTFGPQSVPHEDTWKQVYQAYRKKRLTPRQKLDNVRYGAFYAQHARVVPWWSPQKRRQTVAKVQAQYDRMLRDAVNGLVDPSLRRPHLDWLTGYFLQKVYRYDEAYPYFEDAETNLADNALYLTDYGRLAYNTGEFALADRLFQQAHAHRRSIPVTSEPLQTLRWLAKMDRVMARPHREIERLGTLRSEAERGVHHNGTSLTIEDRHKSGRLAMERLGRAYLDAGRAADALAHVEDVLDQIADPDVSALVIPTEEIALGFVLQGIEALVTLDRLDDAEEMADEWTARLHDPAPLARFLRLADRPYSARRTFLKRARDAADAEDRPDGAAATIFFNPKTGAAEPFAEVPGLRPLLSYANQAFRDGLPEEGAELAFDAADRAIAAGQPMMLATVLQDLHKVRDALADSQRVDELFDEANRRFPEAPFVQLQYGLHILETADPERALDQLRKVERLVGSTGDETYRAYLGIALAGTGDRDAGLKQFDQAFDSADVESAPFAFGRAIRWAMEEREFDLALDWADRYLEGQGDATWTVMRSRPILQAAGRAALATGQTERAAEFFDRLLINYAHHITGDQELPDPHALREYARPLALSSFADALAGNVEIARDRLALARHFDPDHDAVPAAAAALALRDGDALAAADALDSDAPAGWLLRALGPAVLDAAEASGADTDRLASLRLRIDRASGTIPTLDELLAQSRQSARSLAEAQAEAEAERQAHLALQASIDDLVADVAEENDRLKAVAAEHRQAVVDAENRLAVTLAEVEAHTPAASAPTGSNTEAAEVLRQAFPNVTFAPGALNDVLALRGSSRASVLRSLGLAQNAPEHLPVRPKTVDLGSRGTAYEVSYPGNGSDSGRLYFTGGGTAWTLERVGTKSTQKADIKALKKG